MGGCGFCFLCGAARQRAAGQRKCKLFLLLCVQSLNLTYLFNCLYFFGWFNFLLGGLYLFLGYLALYTIFARAHTPGPYRRSVG